MQRFRTPAITAAIVIVGLSLLAVANRSDSGRAHAATSGVGGTISIAAVTVSTISVNTTAPTDPLKGFDIHVLGLASAALSGISVTPNASGSLVTPSPFCATLTIAPAEVVYGC